MGQQSSIQSLQPFEMVVDTTIAGDSGVGNFKIETDNFIPYRYKVEWGDGTVSGITTSSDVTHTYPSGGTYTIKISGRFGGYECANSVEADKIISINSWGNIKWSQFVNAFQGSSNLTGVTSEPPILESLNPHTLTPNTDFSRLFNLCTNLDGDFGSWDVSNVTNMTSGFEDCLIFNNGGSPSISGWTTSACINMPSLFRRATLFNQPIGSWDVSNVTNFISMFNNADAFNQDVGSWDVSGALGSGLVSMFQFTNIFNNGGSPSISGWTFNSGNTNMLQLFASTPFNQPIGSWDVSNVQIMDGMFESNNVFNQDIGSWVVSAVTDMSNMFANANAFNQDIGSWDVSNVNDMSRMFHATASNAFDQDIGSWNVSGVTDMTGMLDRTSLSVSNYNSILTGWTGWDGTGATKTLLTGITLDATTLYYSTGTTAEDARNYLTGTTTGLSWTITDAGGV